MAQRDRDEAERPPRGRAGAVGHFLGRVVHQASRWPAIPRRWVDPRPVHLLLEELVDIVTHRGQQGLPELQRDPHFWDLVASLHAKRPRIVRGPRNKDNAALASTTAAEGGEQAAPADVVEATVASDEDAQARSSSEETRQAPSTPDEASAASAEPARTATGSDGGSEASATPSDEGIRSGDPDSDAASLDNEAADGEPAEKAESEEAGG